MTATYRAPMRSRLDEVEPYAAALRGVRLGLCGLGGRFAPSPVDLSEAVARTEQEYGERAAARLGRFAAVPDGSVVWTRTADEAHHRGVLAGPWRYDPATAAHDVDLVHVRACRWSAVASPPAAVLASFARGGRNFQRISAAG